MSKFHGSNADCERDAEVAAHTAAASGLLPLETAVNELLARDGARVARAIGDILAKQGTGLSITGPVRAGRLTDGSIPDLVASGLDAGAAVTVAVEVKLLALQNATLRGVQAENAKSAHGGVDARYVVLTLAAAVPPRAPEVLEHADAVVRGDELAAALRRRGAPKLALLLEVIWALHHGDELPKAVTAPLSFPDIDLLLTAVHTAVRRTTSTQLALSDDVVAAARQQGLHLQQHSTAGPWNSYCSITMTFLTGGGGMVHAGMYRGGGDIRVWCEGDGGQVVGPCSCAQLSGILPGPRGDLEVLGHTPFSNSRKDPLRPHADLRYLPKRSVPTSVTPDVLWAAAAAELADALVLLVSRSGRAAPGVAASAAAGG